MQILDLEMHFVHKSPQLGTTILAVFFDQELGEPEENDFIEQWLQVYKQNQSDDFSLPLENEKAPLFVRNFLKNLDYSEFFSYEGSLTAPPCTPGVQWIILQQIQPISPRQVSYFTRQWNQQTL